MEYVYASMKLILLIEKVEIIQDSTAEHFAGTLNMDDENNLVLFMRKLIRGDISCFDDFNTIDISRSSSDVVRWMFMTVKKFPIDDDLNRSSKPVHKQQSVDIMFKLELVAKTRSVPYSRICQRPKDQEWEELFKFQTLFRDAHSAGVAGFPNRLGLPPSFTSMLYSDTSSSRDRTPELLGYLGQLRDHPEIFDLTTFVKTFEERLHEFKKRRSNKRNLVFL